MNGRTNDQTESAVATAAAGTACGCAVHIQALEQRLAAIEQRCTRDQKTLARVRCQVRAATALAVIASIGAFALGGTPQAHAALTLAGISLDTRVAALERKVAELRHQLGAPGAATAATTSETPRILYTADRSDAVVTRTLYPVMLQNASAPDAFGGSVSRSAFVHTWGPVVSAVGAGIGAARHSTRSAHVRVVFSR